MKKFISTLAALFIASAVSLTAYAEETLDRDYIESEIWEEVWLGKDDDGTEFPESSYKHHVLDKWLDENYGSDEYDWSEIGELKYAYKDYYDTLTEDWDFNDDNNGNWTIETKDNSYRFEMVGGKWNMIDQNGDTVEIFPPFSTLEEETENRIPAGDNGNGDAVGIAIDGAEKPSESLDDTDGKVTADSTEQADKGDSERSRNNTLPLVVGGVAVLGIGVVGIVVYKKRK